MSQYKNYKKVDLPWLTEIPSHWEVRKISQVLKQRTEKNVNSKETFVLSVLKNIGVIPYKDKGNIGNKVSLDLSKYKIVYPDDLVLNSMNVMIGSVGKSIYKGVLSSVYYVLYLMDNNLNNINYIEYLFKNPVFYKSLRVIGKGILEHRLRIPYISLKSQQLILPPLKEQNKIVDFLDWKVNEIDKLIYLDSLLLNKLKTLKDAFIDSTFENLHNTRNIKLKYLGDIFTGSNIQRKDLVESKFKVILYGDIYTKYNYWFDNCINSVRESIFSKSKKIYKNTVLFTTSGETKEDIGKTISYEGNEPLSLGGDVIAFVPSNIIKSKFVSYYCNTTLAKTYKYINSTGDIIVHIRTSTVQNLQIPLVDLEVQEKVILSIDNHLDTYYSYVDVLNKKIKLLKELRQALITEVVTGKRNVQDIVIPEYEKFDYTLNLSEDDIDTEDLDSLEDLDNLEQLED